MYTVEFLEPIGECRAVQKQLKLPLQPRGSRGVLCSLFGSEWRKYGLVQSTVAESTVRLYRKDELIGYWKLESK